jgi:hypothetical protein
MNLTFVCQDKIRITSLRPTVLRDCTQLLRFIFSRIQARGLRALWVFWLERIERPEIQEEPLNTLYLRIQALGLGSALKYKNILLNH